jgi:hypothetical protein
MWRRFCCGFFVTILGGDTDSASIVFLSLRNRQSKVQAIKAVGRAKLPDNHYALLHAILKIAEKNQESRDLIAHGKWGDHEELPGALLLGGLGEVSADTVYVYRNKDFQEIIAANERLAHFAMNLWMILQKHPANEGNYMEKELCSAPEIKATLERYKRRDRRKA